VQILAFSDLHGDATTLKLLKDSIKDEGYDYMLIAGDLTNADLIPPSEIVLQVKEIFSILESFKIPYYYVWGTPFREHILALTMRLAEHPEDFEVEDQQDKLIFRIRKGDREETAMVSKAGYRLLEELSSFMSSLRFGEHLGEEPIKLERYWLTSFPEKVPENAIFLRHHYRRIIPKALIQLDGHIHYGQRVSNYLNLGFLFRDATHNAQPMVGCYWKLILKDSTVSANFINLGNYLKEYKCPHHPEEGLFYIPSNWKKCPVCYNPNKAIRKEGDRAFCTLLS
jgi:hypothetical protein